jgi:hypothetical protein
VGMTIEVKLHAVMTHRFDMVTINNSGFYKNLNRGGLKDAGFNRAFNIFAGASIDDDRINACSLKQMR